jgi:hypothetical protein
MSVSPQDFALWSQMTGRPYPQSPAERMALAPEVYSYTRSIGRQGGPTMGPVRRTVDVIGKAALAAGALAGAGYLVSKYGGGNPPPPTGFGALALDTEPEVHPPEVRYAPDVTSVVARTSGDITPQPPSDNYNQNIVNNQTALVQDLKGLSSQKPTQVSSEAEPATQNAVITTSQSFRPGAEEDQLIGGAVEKANAFRQSKMYETMQLAYPGLRDTDVEMLGGPEAAPTAAVAPVVVVEPETRSVETQPKLADLFGAQLQAMAQSDARLYRSAGQHIGAMRQILNEAEGAPQGVSQESQLAIAPAIRSAAVGPSLEEIRDLDKTLLLAHGANTNRIQREAMRDEMLAKKYSGQSESSPEYVGTGETVAAAAQPSSGAINPVVLPPAAPRRKKLSEQLGEDLNQLGQGLGAMTRTVDAMMQNQADSLARRSANLQAELADLGGASNSEQPPAPKEFLRQKVAASSPLEAARQNIAIRKQLSAPTTEFQNLGYSTEKSDEGGYDPQYQNLLQSHLDRSMRSGQVEPGSAAHLAQSAALPGGEELAHYQKAYGRAFPAHFQY